MKAGIKKKFLDILFEDYEDDEAEEEKAVETPIFKDEEKPESPVNAREVLYRKKEGSAFIDLDETVKPDVVSEEEKIKKEYEMSSQLSPIFGVVGEKQRNIQPKMEVDDTQTNRPESSHLDIITSPIYGYGQQDESNYMPSSNDSNAEDDMPFDEEPYRDEEFNDLMDYVDSEQQNETETAREDQTEFYDSDDQSRDIPYYDENVLNEEYDYEDISLFDDTEEE
ncbi:MAG: hypothetical protein J5796_02805 [Erysipelotrichaceae bacterium]|nr:hypothetical protein [Erysipelotrichaceae bacterium]